MNTGASSAVVDIYDLDLTKDGDVCDTSQLKNLYSKQYTCSSRKAIGLEKLFILHADAQWKNNTLASALSNYSIHLSSIDTLARLDTIVAHQESIVNIRFSPDNPNYLMSASSGGIIRLWDLRNSKKASQEFKGISFHSTSRCRPIFTSCLQKTMSDIQSLYCPVTSAVTVRRCALGRNR